MPSPFRTLGAVLCLVFALCFAAPNAYGDSFTPIFTTSTCSGICALPTAADVTFPSPTSINVTFAGLTQFVSIPAGDASGDLYTWNAAAIPAGGNLGFFLGDLTNGTGFNTFSCGGGTINGLVLSCGTLTFTPEKIKQLSDAGAKGTPRVASKLANRLSNVDEELYWDEARRFYSNISRLSANEYNSMAPQMQRAVGQLGRALGDVLSDTALTVGKGDEYAQAMQFYRTSKGWQQFGSDAWTFLKKAAPYAVGAGAGARLGMNALSSILEK